MSIVQHLETIGRAPLQALDAMSRAVWTDHAAGRLADAEAQALAEAIETRRKALKRPAQAHSPLKVVVVRFWTPAGRALCFSQAVHALETMRMIDGRCFAPGCGRSVT